VQIVGYINTNKDHLRGQKLNSPQLVSTYALGTAIAQYRIWQV